MLLFAWEKPLNWLKGIIPEKQSFPNWPIVCNPENIYVLLFSLAKTKLTKIDTALYLHLIWLKHLIVHLFKTPWFHAFVNPNQTLSSISTTIVFPVKLGTIWTNRTLNFVLEILAQFFLVSLIKHFQMSLV